MRDFSIGLYHQFLDCLQECDYAFQTIADFLESAEQRVVLLRHDVDDRKHHSLAFARIQYRRGIRGTYYFRMVPQSFDENVIREIYDMGHEIGYHYEDMDLAGGRPEKAIRLFESHLEQLRKVVPVKTICMHGSPLSRHDNRSIWNYYNYRQYDIIGEPYFDIDFREVAYLTDTGRRWDGHRVNVRDKVDGTHMDNFRTTHQIINALLENHFPMRVLFNFHPQRWTDNYGIWLKDKYLQSFKNLLKYLLISARGERVGAADVRS